MGRLGPPDFDTRETATWIYQSGMDPDAFIMFENGRVAEVKLPFQTCPPSLF